MNTLYTSIRKSLDTVLSDIVAAQTTLLTRANAEREEMNALLARMAATAVDIDSLGLVCSEMSAELADIYCDCVDLSQKINDAMEDPNDRCPECSYEDFVGFCTECGSEVTYEDMGYQFDPEDDSVVCCDCCAVDEQHLAEVVEPVIGA